MSSKRSTGLSIGILEPNLNRCRFSHLFFEKGTSVKDKLPISVFAHSLNNINKIKYLQILIRIGGMFYHCLFLY